MDEQPLNADILDLATHKMCGMLCRQNTRWALTSPFHPYRPTRADGGCFLSHYSTLANGFPLGNMMLCVARTFLTQHIELRATRHATAIIIPIILQRYAHFHNFQPRSAFFYTPSSPASALSSYFLQFCHVFIFNLFLHIVSTQPPNFKHLLNPQFFLLIYIKITH